MKRKREATDNILNTSFLEVFNHLEIATAFIRHFGYIDAMFASLRLFFLTLISVFVLSLALLGLRQVGLRQSFAPPHHPWFEQETLTVVRPAGCTLPELQAFHQKNPGAILWIGFHGRNLRWDVDCGEKSYPLADLTQALPKAQWLFEITARTNHGFTELNKDFQPLLENPRVAVMSPSHVVIKELRKEFPQWLFVADATSITKMRLFNALFIEPLADLWPDIFIFEPNRKAQNHLPPRLMTEVLRRKKIVLWDARNSDSSTSRVLTNRPSELL